MENEKSNTADEILNMEIVMDNVSYFLEHLQELLLGSSDPLKQAAYFGLLFDEAPTYNDLLFGTAKLAPYIKLNEKNKGQLVPVGDPSNPQFEKALAWLDDLRRVYHESEEETSFNDF
ncbi:MAG: hypothetical protein AAB553_05180 [Patescibacteria group bacterium]